MNSIVLDRVRTFSLPKPFLRGVHICTLFTLAAAHPLYEVLGHERHASFFAAHSVEAIDIWLFVATCTLLAPLAVIVSLALIGILSSRLAAYGHLAVVGLLFAALFCRFFTLALPETGAAALALAVGATLSALFLYARKAAVRSFVTYLAPALLISPLVFVTKPSVKSVLSTKPAGTHQTVFGDDDVPNVVVIVFDELPLISLMDEQRQIDRPRYPNFARLQSTSTWYREASTVSQMTRDALPAILTGSYMDRYLKRVGGTIEGRPDSREFPGNLLSLLDGSHEVLAIESMTRFAPEHQETARYVPPITRRMAALLLDSAVVVAHVVSPQALRDKLPPLFGRWSDFLGEEAVEATVAWPYEGKEPEKVRRFIELIKRRKQPAFYFLHVLLPHIPYQYNERGQRHRSKVSHDGSPRQVKGVNAWPNEAAANRAQQALLLQVGFTDLLLGRILDQLAAHELLDPTLLVVTADHGITTYWDSAGLPEEEVLKIQASELLYVPLFIKVPWQREGETSDRLVQLIDIVPTIADRLGIDVPWEMDGVSVFAEDATVDKRSGRFPQALDFDRVIDPQLRALSRKLALFGSGGFDGVYASGPHADLVGSSTASLPGKVAHGIVHFKEAHRYRKVDPGASYLPAYIDGYVDGVDAAEIGARPAVAIAVNGFVRGVGATLVADDKLEFLVRVPPRSFVPGRNEVTVHVVLENAVGEANTLGTFSLR